MAPATLPAATAAAPATGGASLLIPLLMAFGPALISRLFGGGPGSTQQDKLRQQIMALLSPEAQKNLAAQYYQQNIASPGFSQGQSAIAAGANQTANQVAQNLGARGLSGSGTSDILSGLTPSLVGSQIAGLRTAAQTDANTRAQQNIAAQIAALTGTVSGPSQSQNMLAGGVEAFTPYLTQYLRSKYPNFMAPPPTPTTLTANKSAAPAAAR
jgi:hypothetical protein